MGSELVKQNEIKRDTKGRYLKGVSGGSNGGRKKAEFRLQDIIDERIPPNKWGDIIDAQVAKALSGDTAAAKFLVERRFGEPVDPNERDATDRFFAFLAAIRKP